MLLNPGPGWRARERGHVVERALEQTDGVYGSRFSGAGFGGSVIAFARAGARHFIFSSLMSPDDFLEQAETKILPAIPQLL